MAYVEAHAGLRDHLKTKKVARLLSTKCLQNGALHGMMVSSEQVLETHGIAATRGIFLLPKSIPVRRKARRLSIMLQRRNALVATWVSSLDRRRALRVQKQEADPMYGEFVYVLKAGPYYKIGRTCNLNARLTKIELQMPFKVELFKVINSKDSRFLERTLHWAFAPSRVNGEWFQLTESEARILFNWQPVDHSPFNED